MLLRYATRRRTGVFVVFKGKSEALGFVFLQRSISVFIIQLFVLFGCAVMCDFLHLSISLFETMNLYRVLSQDCRVIMLQTYHVCKLKKRYETIKANFIFFPPKGLR